METPDHEHFHAMKDHDLLVVIAVKVKALESHSQEQNGYIKGLMTQALKTEGALMFGRWVLGITIGSAGAASLVSLVVYFANGGI